MRVVVWCVCPRMAYLTMCRSASYGIAARRQLVPMMFWVQRPLGHAGHHCAACIYASGAHLVSVQLDEGCTHASRSCMWGGLCVVCSDLQPILMSHEQLMDCIIARSVAGRTSIHVAHQATTWRLLCKMLIAQHASHSPLHHPHQGCHSILRRCQRARDFGHSL